MKRGKPLARKSRLTAKRPMKRGTKKLPKVNVRQAAKRRKSYAQKLAAYRRSETYKIVEKRADGQCENEVTMGIIRAPKEWEGMPQVVRCANTFGLAHHHKTYARFGGKELPKDMLVVCEICHALLEGDHPTRRHGR